MYDLMPCMGIVNAGYSFTAKSPAMYRFFFSQNFICHYSMKLMFEGFRFHRFRKR